MLKSTPAWTLSYRLNQVKVIGRIYLLFKRKRRNLNIYLEFYWNIFQTHNRHRWNCRVFSTNNDTKYYVNSQIRWIVSQSYAEFTLNVFTGSHWMNYDIRVLSFNCPLVESISNFTYRSLYGKGELCIKRFLTFVHTLTLWHFRT